MAQQQQVQVNIADLPLRITQIQIEGSRGVNPQIPIAYLQIFNDCRTMAQLNPAAAAAWAHMTASGHYKDVQFSFIPDNETNEFSNNVRIFCQLTESDQWGISTGVSQSMDATAAEGNITFWQKNLINGYGERVELQVGNNHKNTASDFSIGLTNLKNTMNSKYNSQIKFHRTDVTRDWVSGFNEKTSALQLGVSSYDNMTNFQYEIALRTANPTQLKPEGEIIKSSYEPNLKSSIRMSHVKNTLDNDVFPRNGSYYNYTTEASGLIGDCHSLKLSGGYRYHQPISPTATLSLTLRGGIQQPLRNIYNVLRNKNFKTSDQFDAEKEYLDIPIFDRFFAGFLNTRGLRPEDIGPKAGRHAFGSDAFCSTTASISFAVPQYEDLPIRPHIFFNASQFMSLSTLLRQRYGGVSRGLIDTSHTSASVGVGVTAAILGGHFEINVGSQIKNNKIMKPTLSVGVSSNYDW